MQARSSPTIARSTRPDCRSRPPREPRSRRPRPTCGHPSCPPRPPRITRHRSNVGDTPVIRKLSTLAIVAGLGLLAWAGTVYVWKDPFTAIYTAFEQRRLESSLEETFDAWRPLATAKPKSEPVDVHREAQAYRMSAEAGEPAPPLQHPQTHLHVVLVHRT